MSCDGWDLKLGRINTNREFYQSLEEWDIEKQGFGNGKYDAGIFYNVLEHLIDLEKTSKKSRDALNLGGTVLVSLPTCRLPE